MITPATGISTVGFAAVFYSGNANGITVVMEADAVISNPQPELRRFNVLKALDIAFASGQITSQDMQDVERGGLVDGTKLSLGLIIPDNALAHVYLYRFVL
jgi:hypothetical protein